MCEDDPEVSEDAIRFTKKLAVIGLIFISSIIAILLIFTFL
ncbi:hypothetical protein [Ornithinibacillus xuwenensis]|uniref:Uncharacterized protein n=1 Tax=Ornithinibacillus xuwenensis TaxID=3144668 RepID=A0ABU9XE14_9BACI